MRSVIVKQNLIGQVVECLKQLTAIENYTERQRVYKDNHPHTTK